MSITIAVNQTNVPRCQTYTPRPLTISDVKEAVETLVADLLYSPLFSPYRNEILEWLEAMNGHDLTTDTGLQKASSALCSLIHRGIRPALKIHSSNLLLVKQLSHFEKKCIQILELTCPDAATRQKWLESRPNLAKKSENKENKPQLNQDTLAKTFGAIKTQLHELKENRTLKPRAIHLQLPALTRRAATLSQQIPGHSVSGLPR